MSNRSVQCLALPLTLILASCAQPIRDPIVTPDPNRMLTVEAIFKDKSFEAEQPGQIRWLDDDSGFTTLETIAAYADTPPERDEAGDVVPWPQDIVRYDPETLARTVLVTAEQLTPEGADNALTIDNYHWSDDRSRLLIYTNSKKVWRTKSRGDYWVLDLDNNSLWQLGGEQAAPSSLMFAKFSPDASRVAFVREDNIFVQNLSNQSIEQLTFNTEAHLINGLFDWVYEEEFSIQDGFRWSPDGEHIAYWQLDTSAAQDFIMINNTDGLYPTLTRFPYPKVGEENPAARIGVVTLNEKSTVWADLPGVAKDMYVPRMAWAKSGSHVVIQQMNRKQDTNHVFLFDPKTSDLSTLLIEREETFIEDVTDLTWFEREDAFLWVSERDGWRHIYRVSGDGQTIINLTPGEFDITEVGSIDEANGWLYFIASPESPLQRYLYRAPLDGDGPMQRVTPDNYAGTNSYQISADSRWAIHKHSSFTQPPQYRLISLADHQAKHVLEDNQALIDKLAELDLGSHEFFQVATRDGLSLDGYIRRPPNFDKRKTYPVVHYVYGEPAGQTVRDMWGGERHLWQMMMSQLGFITTSVDNRGTKSPRGRDWRRSVYGGIGILGSRDQSDAMAAMARRWSYIDQERIGVWGHSGGGSMTLNLMFRYPEQFHVGVSSAPVADQRLYDTIYQERYSGLLDQFAEGYEQGSPINFASQLQGKLLLVHGTGDDNVHYQNSERLINELVKHNKAFDFMAYPNRSHSYKEGEGTKLHLYSMMRDYFEEHLRQRPSN
ncbi:MAG: peptidase S9 [Lysobacteraceae bacterium]|nr:MAG: peptidase S9 [Xanthomonadaceae bacterium]